MITDATTLKKPLSNLLLEADLVSSAQLEVALRDQTIYADLRLADILALRGWIKSETVDFFTNQWPELLSNREAPAQPIGFYLKAAGLLNDSQIDVLLEEQKKLGVKFGAMAVLKGWLKEKTVNFFLQHIAPQEQARSPFVGRKEVKSTGVPAANLNNS
jgi:hypothetical protein